MHIKNKLLSIFTIFIMFLCIDRVNAKGNIEITDVSITDRSDSIKAEISKSNDLEINTNIEFYNKDDYVTFKIGVKNNTGEIINIDSISDDIKNEYLLTNYELDNKKINDGETFYFYTTLKYNKVISDKILNIDDVFKIIINYNNGKSSSIDVNPDTGDSVLKYFIVFVLAAISLLLFILMKNKKKKLLILFLSLMTIPCIGNALSMKYNIDVKNNIILHGRYTQFKTGTEVNKQFKLLAGNTIAENDDSTVIEDTNIKSIVRATSLPQNMTMSNNNIISTEESTVPIYAWYDNGTLYYYTEIEKPLLNEDSSNLFMNLTSVETIDLTTINTKNVENMSLMFIYCKNLKELDLSKFNTSNVTNMKSMFACCESLEKLDLTSFDTSKVTNMYALFAQCYKLKDLNLSSFNTSKVTNMAGMFQCCISLVTLDLSSFNTSNVTDMQVMFISQKQYGEMKLEEIKGIENFDTSNVTNMRGMFQLCTSLKELDLSKWDTSKVTDMKNMFYKCSSLVILDLSNFDTSNVTSMDSMFHFCEGLTSLNVSNFDTSNVTSMKYMFYNSKSLTSLDISSFNTTKVTNMYSMFSQLHNITTIYVSEKFTTDNVTDSTNMFTNSKNIVGGNGTAYDSSKIDKEYARIDTAETPGYFTLKN